MADLAGGGGSPKSARRDFAVIHVQAHSLSRLIDVSVCSRPHEVSNLIRRRASNMGGPMRFLKGVLISDTALKVRSGEVVPTATTSAVIARRHHAGHMCSTL